MTFPDRRTGEPGRRVTDRGYSIAQTAEAEQLEANRLAAEQGAPMPAPLDVREQSAPLSYDEKQAPNVRCRGCGVVARVPDPATWRCGRCGA